MFRKLNLLLTLLAVIIFTQACDNDSVDPMPVATGSFKVTIENIGEVYPFSCSGVFNTPTGATEAGPLTPGNTYEFSFDAAPGSKLSFATMIVHSNDFFYAPDVNGIELFDGNGMQMTGNITSQIYLWDAGTEVNQEPGLGADQPLQGGGTTGAADPNNAVRMAPDDFGNLPSVSDVIQVTLTSTSATGFKLTIENVSTSTTLSTSDGMMHPVPLAPGVFVVHTESAPLFTVGSPDRGEGLEELAEGGDPSVLDASLSEETGLTTPFAPGVFVIHSSGMHLYMNGNMDTHMGLEALAEDGDPSVLYASVSALNEVSASGTFTTPVSGNNPAPIFSGESFSFSFDAMEGDRLSFATMFGQSNDLFVGTSESGIELFVGHMQLSGDITSDLILWDAGTEVNEKPGVGLNQAPRQSGPNTGLNENGDVMPVNDGFSYPAVQNLLRVTIEQM